MNCRGFLPCERRLAYWLMKEPDLEEERLKATPDKQGILIERHSMNDEIGSATITTPTDKNLTVPMDKAGPGLWRGRYQATEPGLHKVAMDNLTAVALVGNGNSREFSKVVATDEPIHPVTDATGGLGELTDPIIGRPGLVDGLAGHPRGFLHLAADLGHGRGQLLGGRCH